MEVQQSSWPDRRTNHGDGTLKAEESFHWTVALGIEWDNAL